MALAYQPSMLDLIEPPGAAVRPLAGAVRRHELTEGAWLDESRGWLHGSDEVLECLLTQVPWRAERRQMYERDVAVPRLLCWYSDACALPHPALVAALAELNTYYAAELGEPFVTAGLCLYRDGRDSVAWHGDRIGRGGRADTMVAILSVGAERPLVLREREPPVDRPRAATRFAVGHGDLVVMGGSCQRTWDHAVPKTSVPTGPRVSIQFRPAGVA